MFEHVPVELLQRAMHPPLVYGQRILADAARTIQQARGNGMCTILTQPEPWAIVREQFATFNTLSVIYMYSI